MDRCSAMARLCPGRGTIAAALFITLLVLYCGVTEFVLWFVVTPWIRYAELWLRYFTLVYATVACIVALYLAKVLPGLQLTSDYFSCGKCATCIRTLRANCEEDVYPDPVHAGDHEQSGPEASPVHDEAPEMIVFAPEFKRLASLEYLIPHLLKHRVLGMDDMDDLENPQRIQTRREKITRLLCIVGRKGQYGVEGMINSLEAETEHAGHRELAEILRQNYFDDTDDDPQTDAPEHDDLESSTSSYASYANTEIHIQTKPGMNVIASRTFSILDSQCCRFEWEDYGMILQVPESTVTEDSPVQIQVCVFLSGQLNVPSEFELISAVYHVAASGKLAKPVQLELQHCANIRSKKEIACLSFVGAHTSCSPPYKFGVMEGKVSFSEMTSYGLISLTNAQLGLVAIARQKIKRSTLLPLLRSSTEVACKYRLQVFYAMLEDLEWVAHLIVTRDHEPWPKLVKEKYYPDELLVAGPNQEVSFERETLSPTIPEGGALSGGWRVMPPSDPGIPRQKVDSLIEPGQLSLRLRWTGAPDTDPQGIDYKVELKGARKPANFFRIQFNPALLSAQYADIVSLHTMGMNDRTKKM